MKKILITTLLLSVSTLLNATKEVKAKIIYNTDDKRVYAVIVENKYQQDKEKCEQYIVSEDGKKILEIMTKNNKGIVTLFYTCNQEITESKRK